MKTKKSFRLLAVLLATLLLTGTMSIALTALAADEQPDWVFDVNGNEATITAYHGNDTDITIPTTVTDPESSTVYNVTALESLNPYNDGNTTIQKITVPNGITKLGDAVFFDFSALETVVLNDDITEIPHSAFENCSALKHIVIGKSVAAIGDYAFNGCPAILSFEVDPENPNYTVFEGNLYNKDKTEIVKYATGNTAETFSIPASVTTIGMGAFDSATNLTTVSMTNNVIIIDGYAFKNCNALKNINLSSNLISIGSHAFSNCQALISIDIPDKASMDQSVFWDCQSLTHIKLPNTANIGSYTFWGCKSLSEIYLPESVKSIDLGAFSGCEALQKINTENVEKIWDDAFQGCLSLTSITLGSNVEYISDCAFNFSAISIIYGYTGSIAETYAKDFGYDFIAITNDTLTDSQTGIQISGAMVQDTALAVNMLENTNNRAVYNISLTAKGETVQPVEAVTVQIPVPAGMDGAACKVYRAEADGTYTDMNAVYADGYLTFTTDHFSEYVVTTGDPAEPETPTDTETTTDTQTPSQPEDTTQTTGPDTTKPQKPTQPAGTTRGASTTEINQTEPTTNTDITNVKIPNTGAAEKANMLLITALTCLLLCSAAAVSIYKVKKKQTK